MADTAKHVDIPHRSGPGLTPEQAAAIIGVKPETLAKWRQLGRGPRYSCALGRDPRYHPDDIDEFLWGGGALVENSVQARHARANRKSPRAA